MKYPFNHQNKTNNKCWQCKWFVEGCCKNKVWCTIITNLMIMNYYTSKDEAVKLATIVSSDTADMSYIDGVATLKPYTKAMLYVEEHNEILPCWSAGRVMQLLPSVIEVEGNEYHPTWQKTIAWSTWYQCGSVTGIWKTGDLIEISIAMLEDLKEGGYLDE